MKSLVLSFIVAVISIAHSNSGIANAQSVNPQVVVDGSLGTEGSILTPQGDRDLITGGAVRGSGLFHSFDALNVAQGRSLYFSPPNAITHIFSRVTGNAPSSIDGMLGVLGEADLFLLNPQGILFGPNAQLALPGSFTASTADSFQLGGLEFSAVSPQAIPPQAVPLLTLNTPFGISTGIDAGTGASARTNAGPIVNRSVANGTGLAVQPGRAIALLGGDITLDNGLISTAGGRIELHSQGNLTLKNQSGIGSNTLGSDAVVNPGPNASNNEIRLTGQTITLEGQSKLISNNASTAAGANIVLEAQNLMVRDGSEIATATQGRGRGGSVLATIPGSITLTNAAGNGTIGDPSFIRTTTLGTATGGEIQIKTGDFLTEYNGYITTQTGAFSAGNGGDLTIEATRSIEGQKSSPQNGLGGGIQVGTRGSGAGGSLNVKTPQLTLNDQHTLLSISWLSGQGGSLQVDADEIQLKNNPLIRPRVLSGIRTIIYGSGDGGDIEITTQNLALETGALLASLIEVGRDDWLRLGSTLDPSLLELLGDPNSSTGRAGNVNVVADTISINGFHPLSPAVPSQISSVTFGPGRAGNVQLTSRELTLQNGGGTGSSSLFAFSNQDNPINSGQGDGGNLTIDADDITVTGSNSQTGLSSLIGTQTGALGDSGNTTINTRRLQVLDGGLINSGTLTSGDGGVLMINAQDSITVDGQYTNGQVSTIGNFALRPNEPLRQAFSLPEIPQGATKTLQLSTERLQITNGGQISAEHQGIGNASNVSIQAGHLLLDRGRIIAETASGRGGDLELTIRDELQLRNQSQISATARDGTGNSGNVLIRANTVLAIPEENSDIIANSQNGRGGNITLRVNGLFGIQFQEQLTNQSDITASSKVEGFDGMVNIALQTTNPVSDLAELPEQPLDLDNQIAATCRRIRGSRFVISGRGGLPQDPRHHLSGTQLLQDWRESSAEISMRNESRNNDPDLNRRSRPVRSMSEQRPTNEPQPINEPQPSAWIEAAGWRLDANNNIQLVSRHTPLANAHTSHHCSSTPSNKL